MISESYTEAFPSPDADKNPASLPRNSQIKEIHESMLLYDKRTKKTKTEGKSDLPYINKASSAISNTS